MESIPRRPKPCEDEGELLRQMEDFEKVKNPSISKQNVISLQNKKVSKFAERRKVLANEQEKGIFKEEPESSQRVLQAVVKEREFDYDQFLRTTLLKKPNVEGFPNVMKLESLEPSSNSDCKKSLFALQISNEPRSQSSGLTSKLVASDHARQWGESSRILQVSSVLSEKERNDIHEANVAILDARSHEQLAKDREELMATMSPDVIQYLVKRKASKRPVTEDLNMQAEPPNEDSKKIHLESKYLHMHKVEQDKMQWMEDVPTTAELQSQNFSARFDFNGNLLPYYSDTIPHNAGLHHHGDEPHRPGYTLEELMTLARSTNAQQASIAIQTLGKIICNERHGRFIGCFENDSLLVKLLEADLVTILRISLDNHHSEVLIDASIQALSELLYVELEEQYLDYSFFYTNGHIQPSLCAKLVEDKDFKEEASELKDIQVMNADLVLGLLRTNLVDRLCYLIEIQKVKSVLTISAILKILIRFARHSLSVAHGFVKHTRLLKVIFENFLPFSNPVHYALKFVRLLMLRGRNIAKELLANHGLGPKILCYLSIEPSNQDDFLQESLRSIVEAGRTWIVLLNYGLGTDLFMEYHPVLIRHMVYLNTHLSMTDDEKASKFNYHFAVVLFAIIKAALFCAPNDDELFIQEDKKAVALLEWSTFTGILEALDLCIRKWTVEMARMTSPLSTFAMDLMSAAVALYSAFFQAQAHSRAFDQVTFRQQLEALMNFLSPLLLHNKTLTMLATNCAQESFFSKRTLVDGRSRDPPNLPTLGIIGIYKGQPSIMASSSTPFEHLAAILQFLNSAKKCHSAIDIVGDFLENFTEYLKLVVEGGFAFKGSRSNWSCREEVHFLHHLVMAFLLNKETYDTSLVLRVSLVLITHYQIDDQRLAEELMRKVIFNQDFIGAEFLGPFLEASATITDSSEQNLDLRSLHELYSKLVLVHKEEPTTPFSVGSLAVNHHGETLLPADWQYLPLLTMLHSKKEDIASKGEIAVAKSCLMWVRILNSCIGIKSAVFAYSRLATVFLAASDFFLDPQIKAFIKQSIADILSCQKSLVFDRDIPGIESFKDFYKELVQQFQAVSYGDPMFALMLLIPMTRGNDKSLKSVLWIDHMECLRSITLTVNDMMSPLTIELFLDQDPDIVRAHMKALATKVIIPQRNPLLYNIVQANLKTVTDEVLLKDIANLMSDG